MPTTHPGRWSGATEDERKAAMAHARKGLLLGAIAKAKSQAEVLGVTITDAQANAAGARILKAEQRERARANQAMAAAAAVKARAARNADWALGQMLRCVRDILTFEPTLHKPTLAAVLSDLTREELDAPDGFNRTRFLKRLDLFTQRSKERAQERSDELTASMVEPWPEGLPTLDVLAAENGEDSWSGLPAFTAGPEHPDYNPDTL
jgi:hypothetical protein